MNVDFENLSLGSLAAGAAIAGVFKLDAARLQATRIKKFGYVITWNGKTGTEGPIFVGFARGATSAVDIAAALNADPQSSFDVPELDRARHDVYVVGVISRNTIASPPNSADSLLHWRTLNWPWKEIPEDDAIIPFAFNRGGGTLTSGCEVNFSIRIVEEFHE